MNQLPLDKRVQILKVFVEGTSICGTARATDVAINTVIKLLNDTGKACLEYHDKVMRNVRAKRVQCDETWTFCYSKQKNVAPENQGMLGYGDTWAWIALDSNTKLILSWRIGQKTDEDACAFMKDLAERVANRIELITDGFRAYINAVDKAFGGQVDYAMLVKNYDDRSHYKNANKRIISGAMDEEVISTSHVERFNLTLRHLNKRFARKTIAFSKKIENLTFSTAISIMYYNFVQIHGTLRVSPAMQAGIVNYLWGFEDIIGLISPLKAKKRGTYKSRTKKSISN
jgi:IS1 family transposase